MTEVMEREPLMRPTIVRRVVPGALEIMERAVEGPEGRMAVCVFWSVEHARRDMYAKGCYPEDGWAAVERDHEELALLFEVLDQLCGGPPRLAYIEPAPGAPELCVLVEPAEFIEALRAEWRELEGLPEEPWPTVLAKALHELSGRKYADVPEMAKRLTDMIGNPEEAEPLEDRLRNEDAEGLGVFVMADVADALHLNDEQRMRLAHAYAFERARHG